MISSQGETQELDAARVVEGASGLSRHVGRCLWMNGEIDKTIDESGHRQYDAVKRVGIHNLRDDVEEGRRAETRPVLKHEQTPRSEGRAELQRGQALSTTVGSLRQPLKDNLNALTAKQPLRVPDSGH